VLFLDQPSTGLDPRARAGLWEIVSGLVTRGTTVLLTTQYMEQATGRPTASPSSARAG
jgi:ABC-2 type transport system ATP-binding protein